MLLFGVVAGNLGLAAHDVDGLLASVRHVRGGPVRLLVLVEADPAALQHNADLFPRPEKNEWGVMIILC